MAKDDDGDRMLSVAYIARVIDRTPYFVRRLIKEGQFPELVTTADGKKMMSENAFNAKLVEMGISLDLWNTKNPVDWGNKAARKRAGALADAHYRATDAEPSAPPTTTAAKKKKRLKKKARKR